jgi:hypothetical protein
MLKSPRNLAVAAAAFLAGMTGVAFLVSFLPPYDKPQDASLSIKTDAIGRIDLPAHVKPDADGVIRLAITDEMRKRHQQEMTKMVDDYFAKSPADRLAYLDQQIALQEQAMKLAGNLTPGQGPGGVSIESSTTQTPGQPPVTETKRIEIKDNAGPKSMMENVNPETRAKLADFLKEMNARRAEKGLPPTKGIQIIKMETRTETPPAKG